MSCAIRPFLPVSANKRHPPTCDIACLTTSGRGARAPEIDGATRYAVEWALRPSADCAAARRAIGMRKGEQDT